ncbi:CHAT domain-containing protein [Planctomicrobium piriforme]|uniref:CHAT domain-containing protein n=1 Tax=Planctomicrobium piriforme TaxID=1576369 RepID=A0A1I3JD87_9PLAN|nr:CHAT domain-containing protein [Planctomicrobium piriforme]SFI58207.1 CHAT domain-containing protein [Planctomicrobium piriforme]
MYTILGIERDASGILIDVKHAPKPVTNQGTLYPVQLIPPNWNLQNAVELHGKHLYDALIKAHRGVQEAFDQLTNSAEASHQLYLKFGNPLADQQYWETLHNNCQFLSLSLQPEIQIGRLTDNTNGIGVDNRAVYPHEFCIMAYLSALRLPAQQEWDNLLAAAHHAIKGGINVKLVVRVGEPGLLQAIQQQKIADGLNFLEIAAIPVLPVDAIKDLENHKPQILHLFCHGSATASQKYLSFGTIANWLDHANGQPASSKPLTLTDAHLKSPGLWLIVLNCCEGARAPAGACSLAYDLVSKQEVPAVIGSLEELGQPQANSLSGRLYTEVIDELTDWLQQGQAELRLMWPKLMARIRHQLEQELASAQIPSTDDRTWSIPVLYVRWTDFVVQREDVITPEMLSKLIEVSNLLKANPAMPAGVKTTIIATILQDVPQEYWPDLHGNLPGPESAAELNDDNTLPNMLSQ